MSAIALFPLHGAVTRVPSDATAFSVREPVWDCNAIAQWIDPSESEQHIAWTRQVWANIEPHTSGGAYVNHLAADDRPEKLRASYGSNYQRLLAVKRKYDPSNLFRFNPNIQP
jgi:FAD/FMN-containing dehydrogenase